MPNMSIPKIYAMTCKGIIIALCKFHYGLQYPAMPDARHLK